MFICMYQPLLSKQYGQNLRLLDRQADTLATKIINVLIYKYNRK